MKPTLDSIFCLDASSKDDVLRLSGPSVGLPPTEWTTATPHKLDVPWKPTPETQYGPKIETWDASGTGHTGYTAGSHSWLLDVDLPAGWYTRISERNST